MNGRNDPTINRRRVSVYWLVVTGLAVVPVLLVESTWQGSTHTHTLMESIAALLALTVGAMALVRYYSKKDNTFLIVGTGFVGAGCMDGYNAVIASDWLINRLPYRLESLIPWSWTASRLLLGIFLLLSWVAWWQERRLNKAKQFNERAVYLATGSVITICFIFLTLVPLPYTYHSEIIVHRPEEFIPALFFLLALMGYLHKGEWRHDVFDHWLVLALIISLITQTLFMPLSDQLFDVQFVAAHLLKIASYLCVLIGLFVNMFVVFRNIDREIEERKPAGQALRESEHTFRALVETTSDWVWAVNQDGVYTYASPKVKDLLGYRPDEVVGKTPFDLMPETEAKRVAEMFRASVQSRVPISRCENINLHKDGHPVVLETSGTPIFDECGQFLGYRGIDRDITERKASEEVLRKLSRAVEQSPNAIIITDTEGRIEYANTGFTKSSGYGLEEAIGQTLRLIRSGKTPPEVYAALWQTIESGRRWHGELLNRKKDGTGYWDFVSISPIKDDNGCVTHYVGVQTDITERKQMEEALRASKERFDLAVRGSTDGIWDWDIVTNEAYLSTRFKNLLGYEDHELQSAFDSWASRLHPDEREAILLALNKHLDTRVPFQAEHRLRCKSGEYRWFLIRGQALWNTEGEAIRMAGSMTDITYRKESEARIERLAYFDELTGLPNRRLLVDRLAQEMSSARRHGMYGALLFLDLDKFKQINDSLGHAVGDILLKEVATRLTSEVRFEDAVGRLAGDEFVVLLSGLSEDAQKAVAKSQTVAEKIRASLSEPYTLKGDSHRVTSSIGVVLFPGTADTADELLQKADRAMYASKKVGRNAIRYYQPDVQNEANSSVMS